MQGDGIKEGLINETVGYLPKQLHAGKKKKKSLHKSVFYADVRNLCL